MATTSATGQTCMRSCMCSSLLGNGGHRLCTGLVLSNTDTKRSDTTCFSTTTTQQQSNNELDAKINFLFLRGAITNLNLIMPHHFFDTRDNRRWQHQDAQVSDLFAIRGGGTAAETSKRIWVIITKSSRNEYEGAEIVPRGPKNQSW